MYFRFPLLLLLIIVGLVGLIIFKGQIDDLVSADPAKTELTSPEQSTQKPTEESPSYEQPLQSISAAELRAHIAFLADDLLEGRDTGSKGAKLAARYIAAQFEKLGLKPVGKGNSFYEPVYLYERTISSASEFKIEVDGELIPLKYKEDFLIETASTSTGTVLVRDLVFTGFGIQAPEYDYDDFKDLDVSGKAAVYLSGEPSSKDDKFFEGEKSTRYSSGSRKRKTARENGADATIRIIRPELLKRIRWRGFQFSYARPKISLKKAASTGDAGDFAAVVIHPKAAELIFAGTQQSFSDINKAALEGPIRSFEMNKKIELKISVDEKQVVEKNVVGFLEGSDPELKSEVVVFTAHYDHVGIGTPVEGDSIYNGAADNASGTAGLIELAEAFSSLPDRPKRSMLFLAFTAEEKGLLGSKYYLSNPIFPISTTVANFNLDMIGIGDTTGIVVYGVERNSLGQMITKAADKIGLKILPDELPEQRIFYRSDHFSFAQKGIPAIMPGFGVDREWFSSEFDKFYHQPSDDVRLSYFNFNYMSKTVQAVFLAGLWVANAEEAPKWTPGDEFDVQKGMQNKTH